MTMAEKLEAAVRMAKSGALRSAIVRATGLTAEQVEKLKAEANERAAMQVMRNLATSHSIVRWLERADGHDIDAIRDAFRRLRGRDPSDGQLLDFASEFAGIDVWAVEDRMVTARVRAAIHAGAVRCRVGRVQLIIANGMITTVLHTKRHAYA